MSFFACCATHVEPQWKQGKARRGGEGRAARARRRTLDTLGSEGILSLPSWILSKVASRSWPWGKAGRGCQAPQQPSSTVEAASAHLERGAAEEHLVDQDAKLPALQGRAGALLV